MKTFEQFKTELIDLYKDRFGGLITITSVEDDIKLIEVKINNEVIYTFSLKLMDDDWQQISVLNGVGFVEYVADEIQKITKQI